ncbi:MAG: hypothetical protein K2J06_07465, partial [Muribaculaceae bacterium]|nr:hypothetical protein [Muribaculaceae bacterium]
LWPGWMLPVMLLIVGYLLFTTFSDPTSTRTIYLIFMLTTASAFIVPQSLFFLPILLIGCAQMRILTLRVVIAAILGIITPGWIAIGFDLCEPADLPLPSIEFASDIFSQTLVEPQTLASVAVIALLGLIAMGANLYKLLSYNAVTRATNGFLTILFMSTLLLLIVDFNNMTVYLPLLITLASYQVTLFLVTRRTDRGWIAIVTVMAIFWGLFFWNLWTSLPSATA